MIVHVASEAGFCPGVKRAVDTAEAYAEAQPGDVVMLGEIVHNDGVVASLSAKGVRVVDSVAELGAPTTVLIRAHGVTPRTLSALREAGHTIVDRTCPFVSHIQRLVAEAGQVGERVIITGAPNHPEVLGVLGYDRGDAIVITSVDEAERMTSLDEPCRLVSQTTFAKTTFEAIGTILSRKIAKLRVFDTICHTTASRQDAARQLASESDVMIVLGSEHSSNTQKLVDVCRRVCARTYILATPDDVRSLLSGLDDDRITIGITAGASTPERMIGEVIHLMTEHESLTNQRTPDEQGTDVQGVAYEAEASTKAADAATTEAETTTSCESAPETTDDTATEGDTASTFEASDDAERKDAPAENADASESAPSPAPPESNTEMTFEAFVESIPQLKKGTIVTGTIIRYDSDYVYVDVKDKSEGRIPLTEFGADFDLDAAVKAHDAIEVYVKSIRNTDFGKEINLSKSRVDYMKDKERVEQAYQDKTPITVRVKSMVKDGLITSYGLIDIYVHRSQIDTRPVKDMTPWVGQTFDLLVTQFEPDRRRLRVAGSRRTLLQRERRRRANEIWKTMEVGEEYEGTVRNLTDFGAFVDLGGVDGLVHISELSWGRIKHPSEVVQVGDKIPVYVREFDPERKRVSLGYRREEMDPYRDVETRFPVGSIVRGIVVRIFAFGAFIEIAPGVDALCHISQISDYRLSKPSEVLAVGMEVDARVLEVSNEARRISVSIRDVEPINPVRDEAPAKASRRGGRQHGDDDLPTSYRDSKGGSSLGDIATFTSLGNDESDDEVDDYEASQLEIDPADDAVTEDLAATDDHIQDTPEA